MIGTMLETSARLLELLSLLQLKRDWTSTELAGRLGVSTRTVRADIGKLRSLGYPVDARPGVAGGYRLAAGTAMPPLLLDDDEAVAVAGDVRAPLLGAAAAVGVVVELPAHGVARGHADVGTVYRPFVRVVVSDVGWGCVPVT